MGGRRVKPSHLDGFTVPFEVPERGCGPQQQLHGIHRGLGKVGNSTVTGLHFERALTTANGHGRRLDALAQPSHQAQSTLGARGRSNHGKLRLSQAPDGIRGTTDPFQQLANLFGNATKFVAPGTAPEVEVRAMREGGGWRFEVVDNGIGIAPPHAERIFGMFQRAPAGDAYPGTGIGLAIAQKVVDAAGGRIWVHPREPGGSVFCFTWPAI